MKYAVSTVASFVCLGIGVALIWPVLMAWWRGK